MATAYARRYYTEETWKPVTDLKEQLEYFNTNFVIPENAETNELTLGDLIEVANKNDKRLTI
jgi:hypothetical protein